MTEFIVAILSLITAVIGLIASIVDFYKLISSSSPTITQTSYSDSTINHITNNQTIYKAPTGINKTHTSNGILYEIFVALCKLFLFGVILAICTWSYFTFYNLLNIIVNVLMCAACLIFFSVPLRPNTTSKEIFLNVLIFAQPFAMSLINRAWNQVAAVNQIAQLISELDGISLLTIIGTIFEKNLIYASSYYLLNMLFAVSMVLFLTIFIVECSTRKTSITFIQKINHFFSRYNLPLIPYVIIIFSAIMLVICKAVQ